VYIDGVLQQCGDAETRHVPLVPSEAQNAKKIVLSTSKRQRLPVLWGMEGEENLT
jgi:hypothetical protein